jgi:putative component of membrane protein insertase Oxa1/YidC/SpoIIIJ protein YidD
MLQPASLALIALYQRHVSPRKGYVCALRATSGGRSCSRYAARAIARAGVWAGVILLRRRLRACAVAAARLVIEKSPEPKPDEPSFEDRTFGSCAPAVREGRKLCCGSLIGGMLAGSER